MSEFVISTRYAKALLSLADEKKSFDSVFNDIKFIHDTLKSSKELRIFLDNPIISSEHKKNALKEIFSKHIGNETNSFLDFLINKGREDILVDICSRFIDLSNSKLNQIDVLISSAVDLSDNQKQEIKSKLENIIKKKVLPEYIIDENIIGGFKAKYGDTVIDASIKRQLEILKKKLFEESYLLN